MSELCRRPFAKYHKQFEFPHRRNKQAYTANCNTSLGTPLLELKEENCSWSATAGISMGWDHGGG